MVAAAPKGVRRAGPKLTVLSFGGGQDSTALLYRIAFDPQMRAELAPHDLLVLMSDTGNEHPLTYLHVMLVKKFCRDHGIEFVFITADMGYHSESWLSLEHSFDKYDNVMSKCYDRKPCTDGLKIQPIYRYLNAHVASRYGYAPEGGKYRGKRALVEFAAEHGKIDMIIGIAGGEERRISTDDEINAQWQKLSVRRVYPLAEWGWDRAACQEYIRSLGMTVPPPSNCMMCPFMDKAELLWLARKYPGVFARWVEYERRKQAKFKHLGDKNYAVLHKRKTLPLVLADAEKEYGDWTLDDLERHRFSHGHCVASKY